jgi:MFS family permease
MKKKIFYGWWIVLAAFVSLFFGFGVIVIGFGVFFKALIEEFGGSRAETAGILAACLLTSGIIGPLVGRFTDKWGPKKVMLPGAIVTGIGLMLFYLVTSRWQIYFLYVLLGGGMAALTLIPCQTAVSNWFIKRRGLAMATALSGIPLGGAAMTPIITYIVYEFGVREAYVFSGIILLIFVLPLVTLLMKRRPQDIGLRPDGKEEEELESESSRSPFVPEGLTSSEAMKTTAFWQLALVFSIYGLTFQSIHSHVIPHLTDMGISPEKAAGTVSLLLLTGLLGRFCVGYLAGRVENQYLYAICLFIMGTGFLSIIGLGMGHAWLLYPFAILFGAGYGGIISLNPLITGNFFGVAHFGEIFGILNIVIIAGTVIGPVITGYMYDMMMSYHAAFLLFALLTVIGGGISFFLRSPAVKRSSI